ncbi:MAG: hypothetical protein KQI81_13905 [Deltaproteobacteria bacterium]|nr:hypothetical protein [Deltaproteobacteria bacterium]
MQDSPQISWAEQRGFNLDQAIDYSRTKCRTPPRKDEPFYRRCPCYAGDDFQTLLAKIIKARSR